MGLSRWIATILTAVLSIVVGIVVGVVWFMTARGIVPIHPQDACFYFTLYSAISAASGFFSWYMAILIQSGRVRLVRALAVLAIPFFLIFLLSLYDNPFTAYVVIVLFALTSFPSCVVARRRRRGVPKGEVNDK
jgi:hypothetical protein